MNENTLVLIMTADGSKMLAEIKSAEVELGKLGENVVKNNDLTKKNNELIEISKRDYKGLTIEALASAGAFNGANNMSRALSSGLQLLDLRALSTARGFQSLGMAIKQTIASLGIIGAAVTLASLALQGIEAVLQRNLSKAEKQAAEMEKKANAAVERNRKLKEEREKEAREAEEAAKREKARQDEIIRNARERVAEQERLIALRNKEEGARKQAQEKEAADRLAKKREEDERLLAAERDYQQRLSELRSYFTAQAFGNMATMASAFYKLSGEKSKAALAAYKSTAIAQALMDTYKAANSAYSAMAPIPFVGPVLGALAAGAAIAAGLLNVDQIRKTGEGSTSGANTTPPAPNLNVSVPTATQPQEPTRGAAVNNIYIYGSLWDSQSLARELAPHLETAMADGAFNR